jgi:hypothetical protein
MEDSLPLNNQKPMDRIERVLIWVLVWVSWIFIITQLFFPDIDRLFSRERISDAPQENVVHLPNEYPEVDNQQVYDYPEPLAQVVFSWPHNLDSDFPPAQAVFSWPSNLDSDSFPVIPRPSSHVVPEDRVYPQRNLDEEFLDSFLNRAEYEWMLNIANETTKQLFIEELKSNNSMAINLLFHCITWHFHPLRDSTHSYSGFFWTLWTTVPAWSDILEYTVDLSSGDIKYMKRFTVWSNDIIRYYHSGWQLNLIIDGMWIYPNLLNKSKQIRAWALFTDHNFVIHKCRN